MPRKLWNNEIQERRRALMWYWQVFKRKNGEYLHSLWKIKQIEVAINSSKRIMESFLEVNCLKFLYKHCQANVQSWDKAWKNFKVFYWRKYGFIGNGSKVIDRNNGLATIRWGLWVRVQNSQEATNIGLKFKQFLSDVWAIWEKE